jgi:hypothetical protein
MSILQKILDSKGEGANVNPTQVEACFETLREMIKLYLETSVPSLVWREQSIETLDLKKDFIEKNQKKPALYYGLGKSDTDIEVLIIVDAGVVHAASSIALMGPDLPDLAALSKLSLSQLDLFLLEDLVDNAVNIFSDEERVGGNLIWSSLERKSALSFEQILLSDGIEDWMQVVLPFEGRPPPCKESSETTDNSATTDTNARNDISSVTSWPQIYDIRLLMPRHAFDAYMAEVKLQAITCDVLDQEDIAQNWSRRINPTQTRLRSVLESCRMSVADCTRLEIGQVLLLPGASLEAIKIEVEFADKRQVILEGEMGVHKSHKAIRLRSEIDAAFTADVSALLYAPK